MPLCSARRAPTSGTSNCAGIMSAPLDPVFFGYGGQLRSGFGRQVLGRDISSPAAAFGSSTRAAFQKTYASAEADRVKVWASGGNQSQGAIYMSPVRSSTDSVLLNRAVATLKHIQHRTTTYAG